MAEGKKHHSYLCSSAGWEHFIKEASTSDDAAAKALQIELDNGDSNKFVVGAVICVVPIHLDHQETKFVYAPVVLADIGMHKYADELVKAIDSDTGGRNKDGEGED